ncbi:MAG TPA: outer-membrane lipoprotein carrier protein LolA [Afifellaceae bacterium]|nr:outer-membrane lipoprotein carrier protein LolA [Afifellaceae bacterium]
MIAMVGVRRALAVLTLVGAVFVAGAAAAMTEEERAALAAISQKFSGIGTMNGEFVQFGPSGDRTQGKFYIERPGKVRFQYDPPTTVSVIADGDSVLIHDRKLQTYDLVKLSQTPLRFLLDNRLDLTRFDKVRSVTVEPDLIQVVIVDDSRFGGGRLTLFFDKETFELRQWTVTDQQGLDTSVAIYNVETGNRLSSDLFKINYSAVTTSSRERR